MLVVYHRNREYSKSPNGIIPVLSKVCSSWLSWTTDPLDKTNVLLTDEEVYEFYHGVCKGSLWPALHGFFHALPEDAWAGWETFCRINRRFANFIMKHHAGTPKVWIHDYNLIMLPQYLRNLGYQGKISLFFHTTVASCDEIQQAIPMWRDLLDSLLACDIVGVHIPRYANNLGQLARSVGVVTTAAPVNVDVFRGRASPLFDPCSTVTMGSTKIVALPMPLYSAGTLHSVDRSAPLVQRRRKRILCFSRIDYIKNPCGTLRMFEAMLERYPTDQARVELWFGCAPSKSKTYMGIQDNVDRLVRRVHDAYGSAFRHFSKGLPREELLVAMGDADVCVVPSYRDGLNMVAKEFVMCAKDDGVLFLSSSTGASVELSSPVLFHPRGRPEHLAEKLHHALFAMPVEEKRARMKELKAHVQGASIDAWVDHHICA